MGEDPVVVEVDLIAEDRRLPIAGDLAQDVDAPDTKERTLVAEPCRKVAVRALLEEQQVHDEATEVRGPGDPLDDGVVEVRPRQLPQRWREPGLDLGEALPIGLGHLVEGLVAELAVDPAAGEVLQVRLPLVSESVATRGYAGAGVERVRHWPAGE